MKEKKRVTILDDHQNIIDGYVFRLSANPQIEIAATINFGEELEPMLEKHPTDVLLLDVNVPTSADNPNQYPILHLIPKLLEMYDDLSILVISMYTELSSLIASQHFGLAGMVERANLIGAEINIHSNRNSGTKVQIKWAGNEQG